MLVHMVLRLQVSTPSLPFAAQGLELVETAPTPLAATQLARSSVLNRLIAPAGLFTRVDARFAGAPE